MPRIIRILNRLAIGGPVLNATYLSRYMAPEFETLLVVGEKEDHEQSAEHITTKLGLEYKTIPGMGRSINPLRDRKAYNDLKKIIRSFKPDIVHTHAAKPGALGRLAASACDVPVIVHTFHGHVFHSYFNSRKTRLFVEIERYMAKRSDAIVVISNQQKKELSEDFRIAPADKMRVIPLGFDLDRFHEQRDEKRRSFRSHYNIAEDEIAIGIIGRLVPIKNHALFIKALKYVLDRTGKKVRAFIVGDGESRNGLEKLATELQIPFDIETDKEFSKPLNFTSWRSDIDVINAGLDIITLTSLNEGTPVSLIEAQAANRPVVSTRVGGIGDIMLDGETGLLSDVQDEEGFCRHLLQVVEDDDLRYRLGATSDSFVMQKFSYQRLVSDMSQLYNELLQKKRK